MHFHVIHACCMPFPLHLPQFGRMQIMKLPIIQFCLSGMMNMILIFRYSLLVFIALSWLQVRPCRAVKLPKHPCNSSWEDEYRLSTAWIHPFPPTPYTHQCLNRQQSPTNFFHIFSFLGTVLHHCGALLLVNIAFLLPANFAVASHTPPTARYIKGLLITSN